MKLFAEIEGKQSEINIKRKGKTVFAQIDGQEYELEASEPEPNVYLFKHENNVYEVFVSPDQDISEPQKIKVGKAEFEVTLTDPKKLRSSGVGAGSADGVAEIRTAMPGKVVKILLAENSEVASGEGVIIVEAMKMQNEMKSPKDGMIKEIKFNEGDTVNAGDVLVIIE